MQPFDIPSSTGAAANAINAINAINANPVALIVAAVATRDRTVVLGVKGESMHQNLLCNKNIHY